jgi:hypothetical protein
VDEKGWETKVPRATMNNQMPWLRERDVSATAINAQATAMFLTTWSINIFFASKWL